ncbi:helix-turn-helix domain-containing protein, partial [Streptomyces palmae]|uniref:helix-turn-helix domain-containing protein n=1 Tax=Streptomyces palmae TaxID=1701085 RepID=UPI001432F31D
PPTPQEIATLRALPRGRGSNLNAAIVALVDKGVEQKAIGKALGLSPGAISSRVKLYRQKTAAHGDPVLKDGE